MSELELRKQMFLDRSAEAWDQAVEKLLRHLKSGEREEYRQLALRLLALDPMVFRSLCGMGINAAAPHSFADAYYNPGDPYLSRMQFVSNLIGYELLDDGEPTVAWFRTTAWGVESVICSPDWEPPKGSGSEGFAQPYFHTSLEAFRSEGHRSARLLTGKSANKVLDWYDADEFFSGDEEFEKRARQRWAQFARDLDELANGVSAGGS